MTETLLRMRKLIKDYVYFPSTVLQIMINGNVKHKQGMYEQVCVSTVHICAFASAKLTNGESTYNVYKR